MNTTILLLIAIPVALLLLWQGVTLRRAKRSVGKAVKGDPAEELHGTRLYFFHAPHCGPCRAIKPLVERLSGEFSNLDMVDVSEQPERAGAFGIAATPSFICVRDGVITEVKLGPVSESWLRTRLVE